MTTMAVSTRMRGLAAILLMAATVARAQDDAGLLAGAQLAAGDFDALALRLAEAIEADPDRAESAGYLAALDDSARALSSRAPLLPPLRRALAKVRDHGWVRQLLAARVIDLLRVEGRRQEADALRDSLGFLSHAAVLGPLADATELDFQRVHDPEQRLDLTATWPRFKRRLGWQAAPSWYDARLDSGVIDPGDFPGDHRDRGVTFVLFQARFEHDTAAFLALSHHRRVQVSINGRRVLDHRCPSVEESALDPELLVGARFPAGWNRILVKLPQAETVRARFLDDRAFPVIPAQVERGLTLHDAGQPSPGDLPALRAPPPWKALVEGDVKTAAQAMMASLVAKNADDRFHFAKRAYEMHPSGWYALRYAEQMLRSGYFPEAHAKNEARKILRAILDQDPVHVGALLGEVDLLADDDKIEDAIRRLKEAIAAHPRCWVLPVRLATLTRGYRFDAQDESQRAMVRALELAPDNLQLVMNQAERLEAAGRFQEAFEWMGRAARLDRNPSPWWMARLAERLNARGRVEQALEVIERALADHPDEQGLIEGRARLLEALKRGQDALAARQLLIERRPFDDGALRAKAQLCDRLERGDEALALYRRALAVTPHDFDLRRMISAREAGALGDAAPLDETLEFDRPYRLDAVAALRNAPGAERWPDASALEVIDQMVVRVWDNGSYSAVVHSLTKVLTPEGEEAETNRRMSGEQLEIRTITPEGRVFIPQNVNGQFEMPEVDLGAGIEQRYRQHREAGIDGTFELPSFWFQDGGFEKPFLHSEYIVLVPKTLRLTVLEHHMPQSATITDKGELLEYRWLVKDSPRLEREVNMPEAEQFLPHVHLGVFDDLDRQFRRVFDGPRPVERPSRIIQAQARAILGENLGASRSVRERLETLIRWVNTTIEGSGGGWSPEATLFEKKGNRGALLKTLLIAAGLRPEQAALFVRESLKQRPVPGMPRFAPQGRRDFVRDEAGDPVFFDADPRLAPVGRMPWEFQGGEALVSDGSQPRLVTLPIAGSDDETERWRATLTVTAQGAVRVQGEQTLRALYGYDWKEQVKDFKADQVQRVGHQLLGERYSGLESPAFAFPRAAEFGAPFRFTFEGLLPRYATRRDLSLSRPPSERSESPRDAERVLRDDENPGLTMPLGLEPLNLSKRFLGKPTRRFDYLWRDSRFNEERITIRLEAPWAFERLPESVVLAGPWGSYQLSVEGQGDELLLRRRVALHPFRLTPAHYPDLVEFCRRVDAAEQQRLTIQGNR